MTTVLSSTAPASSQALARVQPISAAGGWNDEDQVRIGQLRNVCARVGDSHDRVEPQELPTVSASVTRGDFARGPAVDVQNRFSALRGEVSVGEASNLGNRNLIFRRPRRARSAVLESDRMVEPSNTMIDSEIPETHRLTESDGTESIASSGFLNMFGRDLERASVSVRADTERDVTDDDRDVESLVSGRSGASDVSGGSFSEVAHEKEPEDPTPSVQLGTQAFRSGLESLDGGLENQRSFDEECAEVHARSLHSRDAAGVGCCEFGERTKATRSCRVGHGSYSSMPRAKEDVDAQVGSLPGRTVG